MRLLELKGLVAGFGDVFQTHPLSFELDRGLVYFSGANGNGKTTMLRTISSELLPVAGAALINGEPLHHVAKARRHIALASSSPELPGFLTVLEACQFAASLRGTPDWDGRPYCEALNLPVDLLLSTASAGQRRKAEMICALAGEPEILLLDETFAHLDVDAVAQLIGWIESWRQERLVIMTHHGDLPVEPDQVIEISAVKS